MEIHVIETPGLHTAARGPLPLVLGVTGHRDLVLKDIPRIQEALDSLFACLRRQYPHTPLRLLSPLAEGADRLVAKVALQHGAELVAPLPMPETEYRKDFPDTLPEFEALKAQASSVYTLPLPPEAANADAALAGPRRDACYEQAGFHIVKHSQLIVALWNGIPSTVRGGTAQIVEHALAGSAITSASAYLSHGFVSDKAVWHLRVPRLNGSPEKEPNAVSPYYTAVWRFSDKRNRELPFAAAGRNWPKPQFGYLQAMDVFNGEAASLSPRRMHETLDTLLPPSVNGKIIDTSQRIIRSFAAADLISGKYQKTTYKLWQWIFLLAGVMILSFESYTHLWPHGPLLLVYPAAFIAMTIAYAILSRRHLHDRFIDARILAEALRVVIYWRSAGIQENIIDQYLGRHISAIGWVSAAISGLLALPLPDVEFAHDKGLGIADQFWVDRQLRYYTRQSIRQGKRVKLYRRFAIWLYGLTLVFSVCVAIYGAMVTKPSLLRDILILLMASGPGVAVLWIAYAEKQGWEKHVKEYTRNAALFARAHELIVSFEKSKSAASFAYIKNILLELGKEAIWENAEWAVLHRVKPPTTPMG